MKKEHPRIPTCTYRLQFNRWFTFAQAREIVAYLCALGVSDVYSSPYFQVGVESLHGYDITDHQALNPELGTEADFIAMVQTPSDRTLQPNENSPPGIHTIPSGAFVGGGARFGTVGAKVEAFVTGTTSPAATAGEGQPALIASAPRRQRVIWLTFMQWQRFWAWAYFANTSGLAVRS